MQTNIINLSEHLRIGKDMKNRKLIYDGKAKSMFEGPIAGTMIQYFKDDATAFNKKKHEIIEGKGVLNNLISSFIMQTLNNTGVPTHFIRRLNMREQLVKQVDIVPLEVVVRRRAYGSLCTRYNIPEGTELVAPLIEFFLKNDSLNDPLITPEAAVILGFCEPEDIDEIASLAFRITDILSGLFAGAGVNLIDIKYEFGITGFNEETETFPELVLADEISPDNCRLHDMKTGESFDKDVFRKDTGNLAIAYSELAKRFNLLPEMPSNSEDEMGSVTSLQDAISVSLKRKGLLKRTSRLIPNTPHNK